jgi:hypothetical protein
MAGGYGGPRYAARPEKKKKVPVALWIVLGVLAVIIVAAAAASCSPKDDTDLSTQTGDALAADAKSALESGVTVDGITRKLPSGSTVETSLSSDGTAGSTWIVADIDVHGASADSALDACVKAEAALCIAASGNGEIEKVVMNIDDNGTQCAQVIFSRSAGWPESIGTVSDLLSQAESYSIEDYMYGSLSSISVAQSK